MANSDRSIPFYSAKLADIGNGMALEFTCLGCYRSRMLGPTQLPASVLARADKLRIRDLESISHCTVCRRAGRRSNGVRVDVVPGRS